MAKKDEVKLEGTIMVGSPTCPACMIVMGQLNTVGIYPDLTYRDAPRGIAILDIAKTDVTPVVWSNGKVWVGADPATVENMLSTLNPSQSTE